MADDGWNGLDLLWEAALSRESADADLFDVVSFEITSSTPAVTLLSSPGQLSMTLPGNQPERTGTSSRPSVTSGRPAQVHDAPSASSSAALVNRERSKTGKDYANPNHGLRTQVDSDVTEIPKPKRRSRKEMDSDTTAPRPKLTREEETYERLLAVDNINLYQYLPGKEFDQVIQSLVEKKDSQPSAVLKVDQSSSGAVNRNESLIRGISIGNKATAPLYSAGNKDTSDEAEEPAQDVRPHLKTSKAAGKAAIATAYRKALAKDGTEQEQQFPEALPSRTTRRIRAADLLQTYNTAASQVGAMRDLDKIERQINMEERKNDREWQKEKFAKEQ
ncbi:hypothetical protein RvY_08763 [Ramazzottius varieornatus]|uniref:Uncharacterized protein n=1 Tax=Ramazzottius varieornatus TaxID=947166 RepID=A0A1D1VCL0_RAMVA|nr:hypothetical protein RvY_08763 [Ramazzottius varieornatus]